MFALVTGASSGIGLEYAKALAAKGYDMLIVSNQEKEIQETATRLSEQFHVSIWPLYMNLAEENAARELWQYTHEHNLLLICWSIMPVCFSLMI